jgi:hypothetical protein
MKKRVGHHTLVLRHRGTLHSAYSSLGFEERNRIVYVLVKEPLRGSNPGRNIQTPAEASR